MKRWNLAVPGLLLAAIVSSRGYALSAAGESDSRLPEAVKRGDRSAVLSLLRTHVPVDSEEGDGSTALHWAVYQDNLELAKVMLDAHANVNAVTRNGAITPLFMACQNGNAPMIELLLAHGADANGANSFGTTPLMIAAASGSGQAVKVLLDHGALVNAREHTHDQTALMFAANLDRSDAIGVLLAHGADPNLSSKVAPTFRLKTKKDGNVDEVQTRKLDKNGKVIEEEEPPHPTADVLDAKTSAKKAGLTKVPEPGMDEHGVKATAVEPVGIQAKTAEVQDVAAPAQPPTPLDVKKKRREAGAKLMGGLAPLHYAARQGNIAAATALLDGGANINQVSGSEQTTPLVLAIANGHYDFAKVLIDRGADVNIANDMGVAPLYATEDVAWVPKEWSPEPVTAQEKIDHLAMMKLLIAHGANLNARLAKPVWSRIMSENRNWIDPTGATTFWRAAQADDLDAMKLLKDAGADVTLTSKLGTTPLMVAAGLGWAANYSATAANHMAAVEYLMGLGSNVNAKDDLGYTPLHGAAFYGDLTIIHYFVDHGADIHAKTKAGDTVADLANGPFEKSLPNKDATALLVSLGSVNSNNCRSSDCVPPVKKDLPGETVAAVPVAQPAPKP